MNNNLEEQSKEELIELIARLKTKQKFGLVWEDKPEDVVEQCKLELPVLEEVSQRAISPLPSAPTNLIIEGDNYHALSVLNYTHAGKIDFIYVDPPYNTGARDWKYNNEYVDVNDSYRHSKWLSFMEKRLRLAKDLLRPDGVLVVTIDEHEVHRLGLLLEQIFPEAYQQMVTIVINPKGVARTRFSRVEEHAIFCFLGDSVVKGQGDDLLTPGAEEEDSVEDTAAERRPRWAALLRSGSGAQREDRKNMFYPVHIDPERRAVLGVGEPLPLDEDPAFATSNNGLTQVWPIRNDNTLGRWSVGAATLRSLINKGYVSLGEYHAKRRTWSISYLSKQSQAQLAGGLLEVVSYDEVKNVVDVRYTDVASRRIKTVWHRTRHDAGAYGTDLIRTMLGGRPFPFAKSLYAVLDTMRAIVGRHPNAIVLDFFAGSGTTGHAVLALNNQDNGSRQFILCTNNENNIAEEVTYPRILKAIQGYADVLGIPANLRYFKTAFVPKQAVSDDTRYALVQRSTDMICVREGTYELVANEPDFRVFRNSNYYSAILYNIDALQPLKQCLARLGDRPAHIYIFSLTNDTYEEDFADLVGHLSWRLPLC